MADEKLLKALTEGLSSGLTEEQVKEKLVQEGWNKGDINGAYALHILSFKPIGSNLVTAWSRSEKDKKEKFVFRLVKNIGLLILIFLALVALDWGGYTLPLLKQYTVRSYIEQNMGMSDAPPANVQGTTTQPL